MTCSDTLGAMESLIRLLCAISFFLSHEAVSGRIENYKIEEMDSGGTLISDPIPTKIVDNFLSCYFVLHKPRPSPEILLGIRSLKENLDQANQDEIPEKSVWIESLGQMENSIILSKEKITEPTRKANFATKGNSYRSGDIHRTGRKKRTLASGLQQSNMLASILRDWIGIASLQDLVFLAKHVDKNYDRINEVYLNQQRLYSIVNSTSSYVAENRIDIQNLNEGIKNTTKSIASLYKNLLEANEKIELGNQIRDKIAELRTYTSNLQLATTGYQIARSFLEQAKLNSIILPTDSVNELQNNINGQHMPELEFIYKYIQPTFVESTENYVVYVALIPILKPAIFERYILIHMPVFINDSITRRLNEKEIITISTQTPEWFYDTESACIGSKYDASCIISYLDEARNCLYDLITNRKTVNCQWSYEKTDTNILSRRIDRQRLIVSVGSPELAKFNCPGHTPTHETVTGISLITTYSPCSISIGSMYIPSYHAVKRNNYTIPNYIKYSNPILNLDIKKHKKMENYVIPQFEFEKRIAISDNDINSLPSKADWTHPQASKQIEESIGTWECLTYLMSFGFGIFLFLILIYCIIVSGMCGCCANLGRNFLSPIRHCLLRRRSDETIPDPVSMRLSELSELSTDLEPPRRWVRRYSRPSDQSGDIDDDNPSTSYRQGSDVGSPPNSPSIYEPTRSQQSSPTKVSWDPNIPGHKGTRTTVEIHPRTLTDSIVNSLDELTPIPAMRPKNKNNTPEGHDSSLWV